MKIVVVGGSGRVGEKLVCKLRQASHQIIEASPSQGVDAVSGRGLDQALEGAQVVVDVSNPPCLEGDAPLHFFEAAGRRLMAAGRTAGVQHHVVLSIVGTDRLQAAGAYFRAKMLQEEMIRDSGSPYSILRSTQFFEFIAGVVQEGSAEDVVISPSFAQPVAVLEVASVLAELAAGAPRNRVIELAGPERFRLTDLAAEVLTAYEDDRRIVADPCAPYFGAQLSEECLLPGPGARIAALRFEDWLRDSLQP